MGQLVFQATAGGQVALVGPNPSSSFSINVPAVNSTLATLAAQTFTGQQTDTVDASINGLTVGKGNGSVSTNTVVGASAMTATNTGGYNTALGNGALTATTAGGNVGVGYNALTTNSTGLNNTAIGTQSLNTNSSGAYNTSVGLQSLYSNTTASNNTAVGYQAGYSNSVGTCNNFFGYQAGYSSAGSAGFQGNTFMGHVAGTSVTTGTANSFFGTNSGQLVSTGSKNTIIGAYTGNQGGLDIRTASNYIVLSDGDGNPRGIFDGSGNLLVGDTTNTANSKVNIYTATNIGMTVRNGGVQGNYESSDTGRVNYWQFGRDNSSTGNFVFYLNGSQKGYISLSTGAYVPVSDIRAKKNITPLQYGLSEVLAFKPVMYNMIEELDSDKKHIGLIAQETKSIIDEAVDDIKDKDTEFYGLDKAGLVPVLIKAIQELKAEVDSLKQQLGK